MYITNVSLMFIYILVMSVEGREGERLYFTLEVLFKQVALCNLQPRFPKVALQQIPNF
jgi:hypothetical protein